MNFLNPFALFGLAAASIPILLHLLNLRKLRVVEFSTVRFLQELQQTRVRKLRIQQILLLILRTLLVVFAVLAFARPTVPSNLPLLSSNAKGSVVILVDNSNSMGASDQSGQRFRQAQNVAASIVQQLRDGDEVCVLPLAGVDYNRSVGFTRTFLAAKSEIEKMTLSANAASIADGFRRAEGLFRDAAYAHHEVYLISDAQRSTTFREEADSAKQLDNDVSLFVMPIGKGLDGLDKNFSVDSVKLITKLFNPDRPVEVEAFIRNGSNSDVSGIPVTMSFNGSRVAQRVTDIPAGATVSVVLAAPTQRRGLFKVSVELEDDAINGDNYRYVGVTVPNQPKAILIGSNSDVMFVRAAFSVPGSERSAPNVTVYPSVKSAAQALNSADVAYLCGGDVGESDAALLRQFLESGRGLVIFAQEGAAFAKFTQLLGVSANEIIENGSTNNLVNKVEKNHPLFSGVFKDESNSKQVVDSPKLKRMRSAKGGVAVAMTENGSFISEHLVSGGKLLYISVAPGIAWSTFPVTGLFAATLVRSALYLSAPTDQGTSIGLNQPFGAMIPIKNSNNTVFTVTDVLGDTRPINAARTPSGTILSLPAQRTPGVVFVATANGDPVMAVAVNGPTDESVLIYFDSNEWLSSIQQNITAPKQAVLVESGGSVANAIRAAREGSELWPLLIILALVCALSELFLQRYMAREETV
ncbi:MAG: BatA domain-containing protein [Ignavibacteria bacterium]|nr:BatA domain-containing protein [Ignavibacteria bacterium]